MCWLREMKLVNTRLGGIRLTLSTSQSVGWNESTRVVSKDGGWACVWPKWAHLAICDLGRALFSQPWGGLVEEDKVWDGLAVRCKYSWLVNPLSTLNLPTVLWVLSELASCICAFYIQRGFYCKVKYPQLHTVIKTTPNPSLWPTWCPHVAPCIVPSRHMLPVALFCSDNSSKGIKETRFPLVAGQHQLFSTTW